MTEWGSQFAALESPATSSIILAARRPGQPILPGWTRRGANLGWSESAALVNGPGPGARRSARRAVRASAHGAGSRGGRRGERHGGRIGARGRGHARPDRACGAGGSSSVSISQGWGEAGADGPGGEHGSPAAANAAEHTGDNDAD